MSEITGYQEPWLLSDFEYGSGVTALHREIDHFYNYIESTPTEYMMRVEAVGRVEHAVLSLWPDACIEVFGSFRTGLNLPISDIDLVVKNFHMHGEPLLDLKNALIAGGVAEDVNVLDKAAVPVVKFTECISQIKFDISFNTKSGIEAAELVKSFIEQYPELPKLVIILKQFLILQGLNEVYSSGGISSYAITLMCISFLQKKSNETKTFKSDNKLGKLLLKFLDYYGRQFDYFKYGISVRGEGGSVEKCVLQGSFGEYNWLSVLTIEDPITPTNDIGRSSYGALYAKQGFEMAFLKLSKLVDLDSTKLNGSILSSIINVPQAVINYRNWVHYRFRHLTSVGALPINDFGRYFGNVTKYKFNINNPKDEQNKELTTDINGLSLNRNNCQYKGVGC